MKVAIVGQRDNERAVALASDIVASCREAGVTVVVDERTGDALDVDHTPETLPPKDLVGADLIVSIGGDGTFLYAARSAGSTPIMGVNLGEVGFLNAIPPAEAVETVLGEVERVRERGQPRTRHLLRLDAAGPNWSLPAALNEVTVQAPRRGHGQGIDVTVRVDGDVYTTGDADGVIVATPTGSTAYNMSEGGPLVHPDCDDVVVTEMCGTEGMPPLVVDGDRTVAIEVDGSGRAVAVSDGRVREPLSLPTTVTVSRAREPVAVAGPPLDFFSALDKLD